MSAVPVPQSLPVALQHEQRPLAERGDTAGLFWTGEDGFQDDAARRRVERDQATVREYVEGVQAQLDDAVHAAEQHLLALQTPEQHLTSLSLSDVPSLSDIPISQRVTAHALRASVAALVPLVRQLVYATRHALIGLDQIILETLPAHADWQARQSLAYLSPEQLHHPQRRLVAALSKMIFFTHSAAGTDWPLGGTAERLALDTRDLGSAVRMYVDEVVRVGCLAERGSGVKRPPAVGGGPEESITPRPVEMRAWRTLDDTAVRDVLALVVAVGQASEEAVTLEAGKALIGKVNKVFHSLQNLDVLAVLDVDEDGALVGWEEYTGTVGQARERVDEYSDTVRRVHSGAGQLLLHLVDQDERPLTETVHALRAALDDVSTALPNLLAIAKRQAELVPPHLAGRIGAQSSAKAEKQKHYANRQSSSTRSSLASLASLRDRPGTRYYPAGSLDPSGYAISRSQTSLPARSMSRTDSITAGSRNSASSSLTSLSQTDDYTYNYSRNSGTYGKSGTFEERSKSP